MPTHSPRAKKREPARTTGKRTLSPEDSSWYSLRMLVDWARFADFYRTWSKGLILHSLVKMNQARNILEVGTGSGISAFCMATALKAHRAGRVLTVDDGSHWGATVNQMKRLGDLQADQRFAGIVAQAIAPVSTPKQLLAAQREFLVSLRKVLRLEDYVEFLGGTIDPLQVRLRGVRSSPALQRAVEKPIDMLFVDYQSGLFPTLATIATFLPLMAESSSMLFDSESTFQPSFLGIERTIEQLNAGKVPAALIAGASRAQERAIIDLILKRKFHLTHFIDVADSHQNSLMWLQIAPVSVFPYPLTRTRGVGNEVSNIQVLNTQDIKRFFRPDRNE